MANSATRCLSAAPGAQRRKGGPGASRQQSTQSGSGKASSVVTVLGPTPREPGGPLVVSSSRVMPTHQSLGGLSDEELLRRMVETHAERYGDAFWEFFTVRVASSLPARPVMIDIGCGPGLFLRDLGQRYPSASLHGHDATRALIAHARRQRTGVPLTLAVHDVTAQSLPHATGTVDLVSMSSVLH